MKSPAERTAYIRFRELKPNSWTYNFVEVSGHYLKSSNTWGFCVDFLIHRKGWLWIARRKTLRTFSGFRPRIRSLVFPADVSRCVPEQRYCVPFTICTRNFMSLEWYVPCTVRLWPMCPDLDPRTGGGWLSQQLIAEFTLGAFRKTGIFFDTQISVLKAENYIW